MRPSCRRRRGRRCCGSCRRRRGSGFLLRWRRGQWRRGRRGWRGCGGSCGFLWGGLKGDADVDAVLLLRRGVAVVEVFEDDGRIGCLLAQRGQAAVQQVFADGIEVGIGAVVMQDGITPAGDGASQQRRTDVFRRQGEGNAAFAAQGFRQVDGKGAQGAAILPAQVQVDFQAVEGVAEEEVVVRVRQVSDGDGRLRVDGQRVFAVDAGAVVLRVEAVGGAEGAVEGLDVAAIAAVAGDGSHGGIAVAQEPGGAVQAHPFDGFVWRFAHQRAVKAVPVPGRQRRFFGQTVKVEAVAVVVGMQVTQGVVETTRGVVGVVSVHARHGNGGQWTGLAVLRAASLVSPYPTTPRDQVLSRQAASLLG